MKRRKHVYGERRPATPAAHANQLKLRDIRLQRALSVYDVAARLAITAGQVSRIERGTADTTVRRLAQFAELYGVPIRELFADGPASEKPPLRLPPRRKS